MIVAARVAHSVVVDAAVDVLGALEVWRELWARFGRYQDMRNAACFLPVRYLPLAYHVFPTSFEVLVGWGTGRAV
jgi:hypothetical protein